MCERAIEQAEARLGTPAGLLGAIGKVESGRLDPRTQRIRPWPWAVNVDGASLYFAAKPQAMAAVVTALAGGAAAVDVGCMQVDLQQHPTAFHNLAEAFDPDSNAGYAAVFLHSLWAATPAHDWALASGYYHSRTPGLSDDYRQQVQAMLGGLAFSRAVAQRTAFDPGS